MHYAKLKESDSKGYVQYESIYVPFWKRQNYRNHKQIGGYQEVREGLADYKGTQGNLGMIKLLPVYLD